MAGEIAETVNARKLGRRIVFASVAAATLLSGCAGPVLHVPPPNRGQVANARSELQHVVLSPSRSIPASRMVAAVDPVAARISGSAYRLCSRLYPKDHARCARIASPPVRVVPSNRGVNAYADAKDRVTVLGGLVQAVGSDHEMAAVLAHEYAHVILGHVAARQANVAMGHAIGGLAGALLGASLCRSGSNCSAVSGYQRTGAGLGQAAGATAYSSEMELEADHLAAYIVDDAGYDLAEAAKLWIRLAREARQKTPVGRSAIAGFFRTHPFHDIRLARWKQSSSEIARARRAGHHALRPATRFETGRR